MTGPLRIGSILEMPANRRAEREFAKRVDAAFQPDQAAIARVRAAILAQVPRPVPAPQHAPARWSGSFPAWRAVALAVLLVVAVAGGFAVANLRSAPADGSIAGVASPSASAAPSAAVAPVDLGQSQASLANVLTTAKSGDAAALKMVLVTYQADLDADAAKLHRAGANTSTARAQLVAEAKGLASIAPSVTAANAGLFRAVSSDLAGLIASLPVSGRPDPAKPGNNGHPTHAPAPTPTPTKHPGKGNGSGDAGGNGSGTGNGNGNAGGNGNGNAGGSGKGHNKS
jgi:uncharacterized membrane protein YgcG